MTLVHERVDALTLQLLVWIAARPRTYAEAMEAWRTNCPRMPVWEDAVSRGLIRVEPAGRMGDAAIVLTAHGLAAMNAQATPARLA